MYCDGYRLLIFFLVDIARARRPSRTPRRADQPLLLPLQCETTDTKMRLPSGSRVKKNFDSILLSKSRVEGI